MLTYCSLMILIIVLVSILKNVRELINLINKWVIVIYKHMRVPILLFIKIVII